MSEIAAIRMNSCGQVFYVAKDPQSYARLVRSKTSGGETRAVFMEEELGAALVHLREFAKEDRLSWMSAVCEVKKQLGIASVEAIGPLGEFESENDFVPEIKTKEQIQKEVEDARRRQSKSREPVGKATESAVDAPRDRPDQQRSIF